MIHEQQLAEHGRKHRAYERMQVFPHPWKGGWWRVADIIRQQHASTYALLTTAAKYRETVLWNMVLKARRTMERGLTEPPFGFVVPIAQHDPLTVHKFITILMNNGIEVQRALDDFVHGGRAYRGGDYVISTAQPNGILVRSLLSRTFYPDNAITRRDDGRIVRPYDMANFVLAEQMGVTAIPLETHLETPLAMVTDPPQPVGRIHGSGSAGWLVSHAVNDAFRVTNAVLADGGSVFWLRQPLEVGDQRFGPGTLWIPAGRTSSSRVQALARETGVDFTALSTPPTGPAYRLNPLRLATYRRYSGEQLDEGWSRYLFDTWGFPYRRLEADAIRSGGLQNIDVLLVPSDGLSRLKGEGDVSPPGEGKADEYPETFLPPRFTEGLDEQAIETIKAFVKRGGALVLLDHASELALEEMGIPVRNLVEGLEAEEYFSPGSNLWVRYDTTHPLAYGMPERGLVLNWGSPVYRVDRTAFNARIAAPIRYVDRDPLQSGWLVGAQHITGQPAALDVEYGRGRILLIGFRAQHRAQTHGTFKVFFNALYYGAADGIELGGVAAGGSP